MGTWREHREDFVTKWRQRGFDPYLCDGAFGTSALGPLWHDMVPREITYTFSINQILSALGPES